jgi:hypothetical protein
LENPDMPLVNQGRPLFVNQGWPLFVNQGRPLLVNHGLPLVNQGRLFVNHPGLFVNMGALPSDELVNAKPGGLVKTGGKLFLPGGNGMTPGGFEILG